MEKLFEAISVGLILNEIEKNDHDQKLKMKHVGSGWGKMIGSLVPVVAPATMVAGHYIGKDAVDNPNKDIDTKKASHRVGALLDKSNSLQTLKHAGIGAGIGAAALGSLGAAAWHGDPEMMKAGAAAGAIAGAKVGAGIGYIAKGIKDRHAAAKQMGYGKLGRTISAITPLGGFAKPDAVKKDIAKQNNKDR